MIHFTPEHTYIPPKETYFYECGAFVYLINGYFKDWYIMDDFGSAVIPPDLYEGNEESLGY